VSEPYYAWRGTHRRIPGWLDREPAYEPFPALRLWAWLRGKGIIVIRGAVE
jgi:hypothetical protein